MARNAERARTIEGERIRRRLKRSGGSEAVVLPKSWLQRLGVEDEVELVEGEGGILVLPVRREQSIEDEPEFALFLDFMMKKALLHPEELVNVAEMTAGDEELVRNVRTE
ncbi:MAG: AbrB/MazE/SpoVT family DNA-binding domain-containing protein [Chloroflexota bacterium]